MKVSPSSIKLIGVKKGKSNANGTILGRQVTRAADPRAEVRKILAEIGA